MQVNLVLPIQQEHEALEADARVALLLSAIFHLRVHPIDISFVI